MAEGRKMKFEAVDSMAREESGAVSPLPDSVWWMNWEDLKKPSTGAQKANLSEYRVVNLPELEDPLTQLMKCSRKNTSAKVLEKTLANRWPFFRDLHQILSEHGVLAGCRSVCLFTEKG